MNIWVKVIVKGHFYTMENYDIIHINLPVLIG